MPQNILGRRGVIALLFLVLIPAGISAQNWEQTNGPYGGSISAITVNNEGDLFAGMSSNGIMRSTDNGLSWYQVNNDLRFRSNGILLMNDSGHIFAGVNDGIFRSTNNGDAWENVCDSIPVNAMTINGDGVLFFFFLFEGVYKSTNGGTNWQRTDTNFAAVHVLDMLTSSNDIIYAGAHEHGVYKSTDFGVSWIQVGLGGHEILDLEVNNGGDIFAAGFGGVYRSTDNGVSWHQINNGLISDDMQAIGINNAGDLFAATSKGFHHSTNNGDTWLVVDSVNRYINRLLITDSNDLLAVTKGSGVIRSTDNGQSWEPINDGIRLTRISILARNSGDTLFANLAQGGIFRSTDNGENWEDINSGLKDLSIGALGIKSDGTIFAIGYNVIYRSSNHGGNWNPVYVTDYNAPFQGYSSAINSQGHIFAGGNGQPPIRRSTNNGTTWEEIGGDIGLEEGSVVALSINDDDDIFAGTERFLGGVFLSTDNGATWEDADSGITTGFINALAVNSANHVFAGTDRGVFGSTDNGNSWKEMNAGLSDTNSVHSLAIDSRDNIYAGTNYGVYVSMDNGESWMEINDGLPNTSVRAIVVASNDSLFAGTYGEGVFKWHPEDLCGNANGDNLVNVGDAVFIINYVFRDAAAPEPLCIGNVNGDEFDCNVGDAVYLVNYVFKDGPPPVENCCQ